MVVSLKWVAQVLSDQSKISLYIMWHHNTGDEVNQEIAALMPLKMSELVSNNKYLLSNVSHKLT